MHIHLTQAMSSLKIKNFCFNGIGPLNILLEESECIGITGPSGAGKSLFLRAVADLDMHTGEIFCGDVESESISGPGWRKKVGLLPSESSWWFDCVGEHFDNIEFEFFTTLGFKKGVLKWQTNRLSSGERQRLSLLRLLSNRPEVLLLDEPTANLDSENRGLAEKIVTDYRIKNRASVLWVSHDIDQLKRMTSRCFIIDNGTFAQI